MSTYKIITDSACDLPQAMLQELDIPQFPSQSTSGARPAATA